MENKASQKGNSEVLRADIFKMHRGKTIPFKAAVYDSILATCGFCGKPGDDEKPLRVWTNKDNDTKWFYHDQCLFDEVDRDELEEEDLGYVVVDDGKRSSFVQEVKCWGCRETVTLEFYRVYTPDERHWEGVCECGTRNYVDRPDWDQAEAARSSLCPAGKVESKARQKADLGPAKRRNIALSDMFKMGINWLHACKYGPTVQEVANDLYDWATTKIDQPAIGILERETKPAKPIHGTQEVVDRFFEAKRGKLRPDSVKGYRAVLCPFARAYPRLPMEPEPIEAYLCNFSTETTTAQVKFNVLRVFYNWLEKRGVIAVNPIRMVEKPAGQANESLPLNEGQVRALYEAPKTDREQGYVGLMQDHGFRLSEVIRLNVGDVQGDRIRVHGKERKEWFPLLAEVRDCLLKLADGRAPDEPLFKGRQGRLSDSLVQLDIKNLFQRAGIDGVRASPHTLRHTFSTMAYLAGCDWDAVELLLRHKEKKRHVTNRYIHLSPEQRLKLMREKLERYSPLRILYAREPQLGIKPDYTQLATNIITPKGTAQQLPELLDEIIALGEMAHEIKRALGGNGHWPEEIEEIKRLILGGRKG